MGTLTLFFVKTVLCVYHWVYSIDKIKSQVSCKLLYIFDSDSTMLSWLIYCTLNFNFCITNPVCITNDCIMYTTYRYRLYTRYTFYCCSSKELLLFSKLKVRIFKICLIVWQMLHLLKNFWAQIIFGCSFQHFICH